MRYLIAAILLVLTVIAGCADTQTGNGTLEFEVSNENLPIEGAGILIEQTGFSGEPNYIYTNADGLATLELKPFVYSATITKTGMKKASSNRIIVVPNQIAKIKVTLVPDDSEQNSAVQVPAVSAETLPPQENVTDEPLQEIGQEEIIEQTAIEEPWQENTEPVQEPTEEQAQEPLQEWEIIEQPQEEPQEPENIPEIPQDQNPDQDVPADEDIVQEEIVVQEPIEEPVQDEQAPAPVQENQSIPVEVKEVCGNSICEANETPQSCDLDCAKEPNVIVEILERLKKILGIK